MDFKDYLDKTAQDLDREVGQILKLELQKAKKTDRKLEPLLGSFAKSCQGGKRIRGVLVKLGYELAKDERRKTKDILKIGAAYEILHTAVLVHDDIIDQSLLRREEPSLYQELGGNHYGVSQAISLADYGFFLSFKIMLETNFPNLDQALKLFSEVMIDTSLGEMLDLEKTNPLTVMKLKTARYTIAGPLMLGAMLGGANDRLVKSLEEFGESLGIAFQIKDDLLDGEIKEIDQAKKEAKMYKNKAVKVLSTITKNPKLGKILEQMADYLVERSK